MRRRITTAVTLVVLAGLLVGGGLWGWARLTEPVPDVFGGRRDAPICQVAPVAKGDTVTTRQVTVSVLNGGTRNGLARRTLGLLTDRGFAPGTTGNADDDAQVRLVQIWTDDPTSAAVRLVAAQFQQARIVRTTPPAPGVVVVVGNDFQALAKGRRTVVAASDGEICSPPRSTRS